MTDYAEPWDNQGHHSNIYDANGDCIATVFNHRAHIIACVNACKEYDNPADIPHAESYINMSLELDNVKGTIKQLRALLWDKDNTINSLTKQVKAYEKEQ